MHINLGEIGLIVEKLNGLDHALVDLLQIMTKNIFNNFLNV